MRHYPSDDAERTAKTIKWNKHKEDKRIEDTALSYFLFAGNSLESLYTYHFDKELLTETIPVFIAPQHPKRGFFEGCMLIEEVEEV
jgi:hypothetical protein